MADDERRPLAFTRSAIRRDGWPLGPAETVAAVLTAIWLVASVIFFLVAGTGAGAGRLVAGFLAIVLPVALIWIGALVTSAVGAMWEEISRLQASVDTVRRDYLSQPKRAPSQNISELSAKLAALDKTQRELEAAIAALSAPRAAPEAEPHPEEESAQSAMSLDPPGGAQPPLHLDDMIAALQFPADPDDTEGFRALRLALRDRRAGQLVTSAQDTLTLLSQDGIYTDDLIPEPAGAQVWRAFSRGDRTRSVANIGGIRDEVALDRTTARMRQDTIFRDTAHHFLRLFDHVFAEIEESMTDGQIAAFADTRTARAFMLLGQVVGTFDPVEEPATAV